MCTSLGDIVFTAFLSPAKPKKFIWGLGPALLLPSATDDFLGTGKWALGPSVVVLDMQGSWVYGIVASNVWSFVGDEERGDVNLMSLQYFVNYNLPDGWYLTSAPIISSNWDADSGNKWTVPVGGGFGKITRIGKQPVNFSAQAYYNAVTPELGASWQLRLSATFLFPK